MASATPRVVDRDTIFDDVVALLSNYSPPFEVRRDAKNGYHLWSTKPVVIDGRKKKEVFFAGAIPQKSYIGLYYMPVYTDPERKELFEPELLARLKGKSCFHLRRLDPEIARQIAEALKDGLELYRERGWV